MNFDSFLLAVPAPRWLWLTFIVALPLWVAADLRGKSPTPKVARRKSLFLVAVALSFALGLAVYGGPPGPALGQAGLPGREQALSFLAAWAIELALSIDNLFVFLLLFQSFGVGAAARARVLNYGIFGALVLRALAIGAGVALVARYAWIFYIFGAVLVASGAKMLLGHFASHSSPSSHAHNEPAIVAKLRAWLPMASRHAQAARPQAFVLVERGRIRATSLGLLLVAIEASDLIFALDSVPAGFAITSNGWLLFASNSIAILGLRALFVALDQALQGLAYLPLALSFVLLFVGGKMLLHDVVDIGISTSLTVIVFAIGAACLASRLAPPTRRSA